MPQPIDAAELQFLDPAAAEIDPEQLVLQPHPVRDRSAEDLAADESFDPVQYASDYADQIGEADFLVKLAKVDRLRAGKRTIAGTAAEVVKSGVELAKEAPGMAKSLAKSALRLAVGGANPYTGIAVAPPDVAPGVAQGSEQSLKELAAGADTAGAGYATMLRAGQSLAGKVPTAAVAPIASLVSPLAGLFPAFKAGTVGDIAKFFNPESDLVSPENLTDEQYVNRFAAKVAERKSSQEAAAGEGPLATALDFGPDVKADPKAIQAWSLVVDPLNLVPGAEGFSVVSKSGTTLVRAATERAAKSAMEKLGGYVAKQGTKMAERGANTSRTAASTVGAVASSLIGAGPAAGAVIGALTPPAQKLGGWALEKIGKSVEKGPGLGMKAAADVAGGAATGAINAVNPIKNPTSVLPLTAAIGADSDAEGGAMLGGPIAFGALGGAVAGKVKAAKRATQAGTEAALRSLWQAKQRESTPATPLGADPVLDNAHTAADATLRQSDPAAANSVNWIRNRMRESFGSELYLLDGAEFSKRVGASIGAPEGTQFDAAGFFDANTGRVYLNSRATALGHEVGHAIFASMDTGSKVKFIESLQSAYGPELLQQFGDRYNELLAAGKGTEALKLDSADQILEEMAAEVLTRVVNSESFGDNPPGFLRRAAEAATTWAEQLGLYEPALGGENSTALGVGTPAEATKLGAEAVRARAAGDAPTPPPVPPDAGGAGAPPPVPPAGGRASSPPTPPATTAAAAPAAPTPSGTNIRVTPEEQAAADARRKITNATEAEAAISRSPGVYTPENARVFAELNNAMQRPQGEVAPVSIQYRSVNTGGPDSGRSAKLRKAEQDVAYAVEQLGLPADLRTAVEKTTIPYRWTVRDDNVNLNAMSVDKVLANAGTVVDKATTAKAADLIPYANAGGRLTEAGWRQFVADTVVYTRNQANGYGGDGSVVSQPPGYRGDLPPVNQTYRPTTLPKANADFINLAMALPPPRTSRAPKGMADVSPENFPNPQAVKLAKGNLRPVVEPAPTAEAGKEFYTQKGANIPIGETNPLRAQFADRGVDFTGRELFQVTEELNLQDIGSVQSRPQSQFRAPSTDLIRGGFLPEVEVRAAETENRAKRGSFLPDPTAPRPSSLPKNPDVRRVADEYTKSAGLTYRPFEDYVPVVEERAKRLADAYQAAPDQPNDPKVKQAYAKLADETVAQYRALEAAGYKLEPWEGKGEPYKSSAEMAADVRDNKHLWFFLTDNGFGTQTEAAANNPLLAKTGITINGRELLVNDVFRGVHDFFGHAKEGYQFGPQGEYNAYLAHARMFSDDAIPALASETLAQNSWVNYGPHLRRADGSVPKKGDADYVPITERPFADQKATWLPPELIREATPGRFMPATTDAGRAVESRGFSVEPIDEARFGTGQFGVSIRNPAGKEVSRVTAYSKAPGKADVGMAWTSSENRRQGLMEAAYRELGNQLQGAGVERLAGVVVDPQAIVPLREKVFGPASVIRPMPGDNRALRVVSDIRKDAKFMPDAKASREDIGRRQLAARKFRRGYDDLGASQKADVEAALPPWLEQHPAGVRNKQTASAEFKQWFGDWEDPKAFSSAGTVPVSVVVDPTGAPLRVFHSTRGDFSTFETGRKTYDNFGFLGNVETQRHAVFFTDSPAQAEAYSKSGDRFEPGASTMPVFLNIKDPIDFRYSGFDYEGLSEELGIGYNRLRNSLPWELLDGEAGKEFVEAAKKAGYDGVIFEEDTLEPGIRGGATYAVFEPQQIKSAFGNSGAFDAANADIRFMPSMEEYEARRAARAAAAKQPAPAPEKFERPAPGKPQHVARPALPESVGDSDLRLIHYSGASGLAELDPKFMGKGNATPGDMRGLPKTYFFVEGSKTGADKPISGGVPYGARVHGGAIYDLVNGSDPLNWLTMPNREKADRALLDAGYAGLRVKSQGRDVVAMLKPTAVTELGPKGKPAATAKAPAGAPKFMPAPRSRLDRIANAKPGTDTPEFKEWFGDSAFVDKDGKPLVLFHGTDKPFTKVRTNKLKSAPGVLFVTPDAELAATYSFLGTMRRGLGVPDQLADLRLPTVEALLTDQDKAAQFGVADLTGAPEDQRRRAAEALLAYDRAPYGSGLALYGSVPKERVATVDWEGKKWDAGPSGKTTNDLVSSIFDEDLGIDAVWLKNVNDPGPRGEGDAVGDVIAFRNPKRDVKSVDNVGTWDRNTADIRFMPAPRSSVSVFDRPKVTERRPLLDIARELSGANRALGVLDVAKPADQRELATTLADEAEYALSLDPRSAEWYAESIKTAMSNMAELHPEITADPVTGDLYKSLVALTSNQTGVRDNIANGDSLYQSYKRDGRLPEKVNFSATAGPAISKHLRLLQGLIDRVGPEKTVEFLNSDLTAREITKLGFKVSGELADAKLRGSMIFGPKIGAFYSNLRGDFSPVTMDRWFMRTVNRIAGRLVEPNAETASAQIWRALDELKGKRLHQGYELAPVRDQLTLLDREIRKNTLNTDDLFGEKYASLREFVKGVHSAFSSSGFKDRSEINMGVKNAYVNLFGVNESPDNGRHRADIRASVEQTQNLLREKGVDVSNAALQAALWYHEKRLLTHLGYFDKAGSDTVDFATASREYVDAKLRAGSAPASP